MRKFIAKIRNRRLKGNVSLLVIFILLACSVIALLSINQIQRLLTYWNMTFNYFRAFYLAKAGTELGLTEVYNSSDGFNHSIESGNVIVSWNLLPEYSGFNPYFNMTITWSFYTLNNDIRLTWCDEWNKIKLATWDGIMLSLFFDITDGFEKILSDDKDFRALEDIDNLSLSSYNNYNLTFALFTYKKDANGDEYMENIVVYTWSNLTEFLSKPEVYNLIQGDSPVKRYITIKNSWNEDVEFCITKTDHQLIPYSNSLITVRGNYGDMEVWLQSIVKKSVPSWSLNVLE